MHLLPYTAEIHALAVAPPSVPALRAVDAIHVATALSVREEVGIVQDGRWRGAPMASLGPSLVYADDLRAAAYAKGLEAVAPR